jgi:ascorbate-specific PTS system EIIC-type component UlaA
LYEELLEAYLHILCEHCLNIDSVNMETVRSFEVISQVLQIVQNCSNGNCARYASLNYVVIKYFQFLLALPCSFSSSCTGCPMRKVTIPGGHSIGHSKQKVYMYMCPIPNGFGDRAVSVCSSLYMVPKYCSSLLHVNRREASVGFCDC